MTRLPRHRVSDISETGIRLRLFSPDNIRETPVNYVHQDDYYIFGFIESGTCNIRIDFKDYELAVNKTALILPGQVHCFTHSDQLSAYLLMIDSVFVEETSQRAFEQYTLTSQLICLSPQQQFSIAAITSSPELCLRKNIGCTALNTPARSNQTCRKMYRLHEMPQSMHESTITKRQQYE